MLVHVAGDAQHCCGDGAQSHRDVEPVQERPLVGCTQRSEAGTRAALGLCKAVRCFDSAHWCSAACTLALRSGRARRAAAIGVLHSNGGGGHMLSMLGLACAARCKPRRAWLHTATRMELDEPAEASHAQAGLRILKCR